MNTLNTIALSLFALLATAAPALADQAVLQSMFGTVTVKLSATAAAVKARPGMKLPPGAEVTTGANARAIIRFNPQDTVRLAPKTTLQVAALNQNTARDRYTIVRLVSGSVRGLFNRIGNQRKMNFAIASGAAVCAVKGTEIDVVRGTINLPVDVHVQIGQALTFTFLDWKQERMFTATGIAGVIDSGDDAVPVSAGYHVSVSDAGTATPPAPAPVRTTLEVVSGSVEATVNGKTTTVQAGEEIPSGATVKATEDAVLSSPGSSVSADTGETFMFNATATSGGVTTSISVPAGSSAVNVETGGSVATVDAGESVSVATTGSGASTITATTGSITVTSSTGTVSTVTEGTTTTAGTTTTTTTTETTTDATTGQTTTTGENTETAPPPAVPELPPDTTNQTNQVISPSAP